MKVTRPLARHAIPSLGPMRSRQRMRTRPGGWAVQEEVVGRLGRARRGGGPTPMVHRRHRDTACSAPRRHSLAASMKATKLGTLRNRLRGSEERGKGVAASIGEEKTPNEDSKGESGVGPLAHFASRCLDVGVCRRRAGYYLSCLAVPAAPVPTGGQVARCLLFARRLLLAPPSPFTVLLIQKDTSSLPCRAVF